MQGVWLIMEDTRVVQSTQGLLAAIDEMSFWLRIMFEHAKFIRGGLDPSVGQETLIRTAERFAINIQSLHSLTIQTPAQDAFRVNRLVDSSRVLTIPLRDFKAELFKLISDCQVIAELPAPLLDHIRREADFFLTMLNRLEGAPVAQEETLGIPNGSIPTSLVPRLLIPFASGNILAIARDENLFWLRIHKEHGEVLLLVAYRPRIQEMLYDATQQFERDLNSLLEEAQRTPLEPTALRAFNKKAYGVMDNWNMFLRSAYSDVINCRVPSGQINTAALILDHMSREAEYYLRVLEIEDPLLARLQ